jgi:hypothetical protein
MQLKVAVIAVLWFGLMCAQAQRKAVPTIPASVYGTWKIHELREVGGHAGEKPESIGRKITFGQKTITYDKGFLFFDPPCRTVSYTFEIRKIATDEVGGKGTLSYYGLAPKKEGEIQNVVDRCGGRPRYKFELAENNQKALYKEGWFFFLEKVG